MTSLSPIAARVRGEGILVNPVQEKGSQLKGKLDNARNHPLVNERMGLIVVVQEIGYSPVTFMSEAAMNSVFEIQNIKIAYGFRTAVENLSLTLQPGKSLGLLGANGAGKTSTIKALLGMVKVRSGKIHILGSRPGMTSVFSKMGFAPEDGVPADFLTGEEYLQFVGRLKIKSAADRRQQISELLNWFELNPKKYIKEYSKGMKRRIVLAQALLGNPALLILDEPLNGLDPLMIIKLRERLDLYRKNGGTMLYSSHILSEIEKTCSDVSILCEGQLRYQESVEKTVAEHGSVENAFSKFARSA